MWTQTCLPSSFSAWLIEIMCSIRVHGLSTGTFTCLKQMTGMEIPSEVQLTSACFWGNAYDVSGKQQRSSFAQLLAWNIGTLVSCGETTMFGLNKALCLHVNIDVSKPLQRGLHIGIGGKTLCIHFKYIKLHDFCYWCGHLGHILKGCGMIEALEDDPNLQYGTWLRASPLKSRWCNAEPELIEEKKTLLSFSR